MRPTLSFSGETLSSTTNKTSKPVLGLALLALIIAAASLAEVYVVTLQLSQQNKRIDDQNRKADALSTQLGDISKQRSTKPSTVTRTIYTLVLPAVVGDTYDHYSPQTVVVQKGDRVRIVLNNTDDGNAHGFAVDAYGINKVVNPSQSITIEFVADKAGIFTYYCTVFCGAGHLQMTGQLIVLG